ncbi:MAG: winged helix-turn-helix domain-containing protein [Candidatus Bathyarchaeia archaeon]
MNGKTTILELISAGGKTWTEIRKETKLSRPVVSEHLKSLLADELIALPLGSGRGSKYEITPKGRELVLQEEDNRFNDQAAFFRHYDLDTYLPKVPTSEWLQAGYRVRSPEEFLEENYPTFPLPIKAVLKMSENGTYAIDSWVQRMKRKYPALEASEEETLIYEEVARNFTDPTLRKLCEVLFERTRVLCRDHSMGEKGPLPTLDNILNFNFEFLCRYEGETFLKSKEERTKAEHVLAAILLLYLGSDAGGPVGLPFTWHKEHLQALVESGLLTKDEIQPLLETCKSFGWSLHYDDLTDEQKRKFWPEKIKTHSGFLHLQSKDLTDEQKNRIREEYVFMPEDLTDEQKKKITLSAYKRFHLAGPAT